MPEVSGRVTTIAWIAATIGAAALGALGSQLVKRPLDRLEAYWDQERSREVAYHAQLTDGATNGPVEGALVSLWDSEGVTVLGQDETNDRGVAILDVELRWGAYIEDVRLTREGIEYAKTSTIRLDQTPFVRSFVFAPDSWAVVDPRQGQRAGAPVFVETDAPAAPIQGEVPGWLVTAALELGVEEVRGQEHNKRILEYWRSVPVTPDLSDELPWVSPFVEWVLNQHGIEGPRDGRARAWLSWGRAVEPRPGCIAVFWRQSPTDPGGLVGFYLGAEEGALRIIGGNIGNAVAIASIPEARFLGCRMPNDTG